MRSEYHHAPPGAHPARKDIAWLIRFRPAGGSSRECFK